MSLAEQTMTADHGRVQHSVSATAAPAKRSRRLKPEAVARLRSRRGEAQLDHLYQKPVDELSPQEIAAMRAAFFRG